MVTISSGIVVIDGKRINGSDGPVKHLNKNLKTDLIILGVLAAGICLIPVCAGAAIAAKVFLCSWGGSFAIGAGAGAVAGAGIGTGASFIASSITGVEVTSLLGKYIPICIISGIAGALIGAYAFASIGGTNNNINNEPEKINNKKDNNINTNPSMKKNPKEIFKEYTPETRDAWLKKYYKIDEGELINKYGLTIDNLVENKISCDDLWGYEIIF